jgi:hypothetical protein
MQSITSAPRQINAMNKEEDYIKQQTNNHNIIEDIIINDTEQQSNNHNNEGICDDTKQQTKQQINNVDGVFDDGTKQQINIDSSKCDDAAALLVMLYLLLISSLLVIAIIVGIFVVAQYGVVVLVAVCVAGFGMFVVAATVTSVITKDAKLSKARSKIKTWHEICKVKIIDEISNIKADFVAYKSGDLLLTYDDTWQPDDIISSGNDSCPNDIEQSVADEFDNKKQSSQKKTHKPKSLLFKAFSQFRGKDRPDGSQKKSRKLWKRKKKQPTDEVETCNDYEPPTLV